MSVAPQLLTYYDALAAGMDFLRGTSTSSSQEDIRRAIHSTLREICTAADWSFLYKPGRVQLKADLTGTCTYDHTGGAQERLVTTSSITRPTWILDAMLKIGDAVHRVDDIVSGAATHFTLDADMNPGQDVSSTACTVYPGGYHLPWNFISLETTLSESAWLSGEEISYPEWQAMDRYGSATGSTRYFCIAASPDLIGNMSLFIYPPSDSTETLDFIYKRQPYRLRYTGHESAIDNVGTVSVSANGTTVTGSSTAFNGLMAGAVLRFGDTSDVPTGLDGRFPFDEEITIKSVTDSDTLTLTAAAARSHTSVKYTISDAIDFPYVAHNLFYACLRKHLSITRNMDNKAEYVALYNRALAAAKSADWRVTQPRVAGSTHIAGRRLAGSGSYVTDWME